MSANIEKVQNRENSIDYIVKCQAINLYKVCIETFIWFNVV